MYSTPSNYPSNHSNQTPSAAKNNSNTNNNGKKPKDGPKVPKVIRSKKKKVVRGLPSSSSLSSNVEGTLGNAGNAGNTGNTGNAGNASNANNAHGSKSKSKNNKKKQDDKNKNKSKENTQTKKFPKLKPPTPPRNPQHPRTNSKDFVNSPPKTAHFPHPSLPKPSSKKKEKKKFVSRKERVTLSKLSYISKRVKEEGVGYEVDLEGGGWVRVRWEDGEGEFFWRDVLERWEKENGGFVEKEVEVEVEEEEFHDSSVPPYPSTPLTYTPKPSTLQFTTLNVKTFPRCIGCHSLPSDGGWSLGMSSQPLLELEGDVEIFENRKQEELATRYYNLGHDDVKEELETRQYDYKRGRSNVVFGRVGVKERKEVLLEGMEIKEEEAGRRVRSLSDGDFQSMLNGGMDDYNDLLTFHKSIEKEDDLIKDSRDLIGCSCKRLKTRGLREKRLKEELKKRGQSVEGGKDDLQERLRLILDSEPCCSIGCACFELGVECHFDICGCARDPCGNEEGKYVYDRDAVKEKRNKYITGRCEDAK
ncbi:hypothetical protein TL16_g05799 [Triparma laevis f. inornata]|uniref:SAP domain-containing protein n=1 Tax=Triparma laevis f. inornata TaxID=1714386 RepID=A0A9W7AMC7_9STRA|nr:hypothetical protein TL16_g05799 [Triparma laevis f. inornata]